MLSDRAGFWRGHLLAQQRSGLSIKAYCRRHRLSTSGFFTWRKRLGMQRSRPEFLPVALRVSSPAIEVHLPSGVRISVPSEQLSQVFAALRETEPC